MVGSLPCQGQGIGALSRPAGTARSTLRGPPPAYWHIFACGWNCGFNFHKACPMACSSAVKAETHPLHVCGARRITSAAASAKTTRSASFEHAATLAAGEAVSEYNCVSLDNLKVPPLTITPRLSNMGTNPEWCETPLPQFETHGCQLILRPATRRTVSVSSCHSFSARRYGSFAEAQ